MGLDSVNYGDSKSLPAINGPQVSSIEGYRCIGTGFGGNSSAEKFLPNTSISFVSATPDAGSDAKTDGKPAVNPDPEAESKAISDRVEAHYKRVIQPFSELKDTATASEIISAFDQAIERAKELNPADIAKVREQIMKGMPVVKEGDKPDAATREKIESLSKDLEKLKRIEQAEAYLQIQRGVVKLQRGGLKDPAGGYMDPFGGRKDIADGLAKRKELATDPIVVEKILRSGVDKATLKDWFPQLAIDKEQKPDAPDPDKPRLDPPDRNSPQPERNKGRNSPPGDRGQPKDGEPPKGDKAPQPENKTIDKLSRKELSEAYKVVKEKYYTGEGRTDAVKKQLETLEAEKVRRLKKALAEGDDAFFEEIKDIDFGDNSSENLSCAALADLCREGKAGGVFRYGPTKDGKGAEIDFWMQDGTRKTLSLKSSTPTAEEAKQMAAMVRQIRGAKE